MKINRLIKLATLTTMPGDYKLIAVEVVCIRLKLGIKYHSNGPVLRFVSCTFLFILLHRHSIYSNILL